MKMQIKIFLGVVCLLFVMENLNAECPCKRKPKAVKDFAIESNSTRSQ